MNTRLSRYVGIFWGFVGASTVLLGACGGAVEYGDGTPDPRKSTAVPAVIESAAGTPQSGIEVRVVDGRAPGIEDCDAVNPNWQAELCRAYTLLAVGHTTVVEASGDGRVEPGEVLHVSTSVLNLSRCDMSTIPTLSVTSEHPASYENRWIGDAYVFPGKAEWPAAFDIVVPSDAAPGSQLHFEVAPDPLEIPGPECKGGSKALIDIRVE